MADRNKTFQVSNRSRIGLYFFMALFFLSLASALDSYSMNWYIPGDIVGRQLWFNYTMSDWGNLMPEYICFGLGDNSMCLTSNVSNMDLFGYNISNVSIVNVTNQICLGDYCILSWNDIQGTTYDQSLNTTDNVDFLTVTSTNITSDLYCNSTDCYNVTDFLSNGGGSEINMSEYRGSDLSGSDGDLNRTLDVGSTPINVFSDGFMLHQDIDYVASGTVVTFLNYKWDEQYIRVET